MARFEEYATKYQDIRMERRNGILQVTFHTSSLILTPACFMPSYQHTLPPLARYLRPPGVYGYAVI